jgi:3-phosphoshikimate 1-carboxyvinyltransferase
VRLIIEGGMPLKGILEVPADKSITHRALLFSALAQGKSTIEALRPGDDNHSTAKCLRQLGVEVIETPEGWQVRSLGCKRFTAPHEVLDCGNSGTTIRLLTGVLAGLNIKAQLTGDASLSRRPMGRICEPLRALGGNVRGQKIGSKECPPLEIDLGNFLGGTRRLNIASAQVKSALLLAGITSGTAVKVSEPMRSRDHSERMLQSMGAKMKTWEDGDGAWVSLAPNATLTPQHVKVPGDISSAAFWLAAALMVEGSDITVEHLGLNPTRTGILDVLESLGVKAGVVQGTPQGGEPVGSVRVVYAPTRAQDLIVGGPLIPRLVDELIVLAALFSQSEGTTEIRDASEMRVKETDRITETVHLLEAFGVQAEERDEGLVVKGKQPLRAAHVDVKAEHRLAMSAAVLALAAPGTSILDNFEIAEISYKGFAEDMQRLGARVRVEK